MVAAAIMIVPIALQELDQEEEGMMVTDQDTIVMTTKNLIQESIILRHQEMRKGIKIDLVNKENRENAPFTKEDNTTEMNPKDLEWDIMIHQEVAAGVVVTLEEDITMIALLLIIMAVEEVVMEKIDSIQEEVLKSFIMN